MDVNKVRLYLNPLLQLAKDFTNRKVDASELSNKADELNVLLTIVDLHGEVAYSIHGESTKVDIEGELFQDSFYSLVSGQYKVSLPLQMDDTVVGFCIFEIPKETWNYILPEKSMWLFDAIIITSIALLIYTMVMLYFYHRQVERPREILKDAMFEASKGSWNEIDTTTVCGYELLPLFFEYNRMIQAVNLISSQHENYEIQMKKFVATISHELKTPLTSIMAYIEALKNGLAKDGKAQKAYVDIVYDKAVKLSKHIEELFRVSQQSMNQLKINREDKYAKDLFMRILEPIQKQLDSEGIQNTLAIDVKNSLINVDEIRIEQVVLNLVTNAKKHIPAFGEIHIRVYTKDNYVVTEIRDNGCGIKPKDLSYIFDYFYQGENSRKKDYEGAGLGLAICKYIVEAHEGEIYVKSSENEGSIFWFTIPIV